MKIVKIFFFLLLLLKGVSQSQWQPDVRLTNAPGESHTSRNNAWFIGTNGAIVHVVWSDFRDVNYEIYYKRSTDGGINWDTDTRLTNFPEYSVAPCIAVSGPVLHVAWQDRRDMNDEIYYKRSTDGGISWSADTRLTNNSSFSVHVSLSVSGSPPGVVHIVWADSRDGNDEIYYKRSTDGGVSWSTDTRLTNNSFISWYPSVSTSASVVHIVWQDDRDGNWEIYHKRSTDGGISWSADTRLTNNSSMSNNPCVSVSGSVVHVLWGDLRDGNYEIYYKRSSDGGVSWGADTRLTNFSSASTSPSVSVSDPFVHIAWEDFRDGNFEIYHKVSTDGGLSWGTDTRLTNNSAVSRYPSVSISAPAVHVVWQDDRDGNWEIYYKRDPTGSPIGIKNISSEIPEKFYLSQNYPNPFNPTTKFKVQIAKLSNVNIVVFDFTGKKLETLVNEQLLPGTYEVDFDGSKYASGVYFYKLIAADPSVNSGQSFIETKKMTLIK